MKTISQRLSLTREQRSYEREEKLKLPMNRSRSSTLLWPYALEVIFIVLAFIVSFSVALCAIYSGALMIETKTKEKKNKI